jgi:hypothetical protein
MRCSRGKAVRHCRMEHNKRAMPRWIQRIVQGSMRGGAVDRRFGVPMASGACGQSVVACEQVTLVACTYQLFNVGAGRVLPGISQG